eukprot:4603303-Amphidinium_carterae.1
MTASIGFCVRACVRACVSARVRAWVRGSAATGQLEAPQLKALAMESENESALAWSQIVARISLVAEELITQPSIVFLDEPTTGLDSFAAWQVMRSVKALADGGCTVVCTVHQPSSEIFALIDRIICLCHQSTIFQGDLQALVRGPPKIVQFHHIIRPGRASELSHWLEAGGYSCPPEHNPADFVMCLP